MLTMLMWIARLYLWRWLSGGKRARFYSINVMRARHPAWFREDLERLFGLLATRAIQPRVAERISFDEVAEDTAVSRRAVSRASSSRARTFRRHATGRRLSASRGRLPRLILEKRAAFELADERTPRRRN